MTLKQAAFFVGVLVACGAAPEGYEGTEIGSVKQPVVYLNSASKQWGTSKTGLHAACNKTDANQVCTFAREKWIEIVVDADLWTSGQLNVFDEVLTELRQEYGPSGWVFDLVDIGSTNAAATQLYIGQTATVGSGYDINSVFSYSPGIAFNVPTSMTEGGQAGMAAPVGQYQTHQSCTGFVYTGRINARTSNATERLNLFDHVIGSLVIRCMGVGMRADSANSWSRYPISLGGLLNGATAGEKCRANISDMGDLADISRQTLSSCPGD